MSEAQWTSYLQLLAQAPDSSERRCVVCWYEQQQAPFPENDSSRLCDPHAFALRLAHAGQQREVNV